MEAYNIKIERSLVSIIVPVFNSGRLLPDAIESVLAQTYGSWEMLIVDDGSTDNTLNVARDYSAKDQRIKVHPLGRNSGLPAVPRNYGIRHAKGDYIAFLDADDLWLTEKLKTQVEFFKKNEGVFLVFSQIFVEKEGKRLWVKPKAIRSNDFFKDLYLYFNFIGCLTVMMRNKKGKNTYFFDEDPGLASVEDYALWLSIARNEKMAFIDEPLAVYRVHPKSISSNMFLNFGKCRLVLKKFSRFFSKNETFRAYIRFYLKLLSVGILTAAAGAKSALVCSRKGPVK